MSLRSAAEEYFSRLNSMASRLHADMTETKLAYEGLWGTLKYEEQQQILSESIIKPEVCLKYNCGELNVRGAEKYATKVIVDDNSTYYRDEHSAPFSFKTQSQRDLTVFSKCAEDEVVREKPVVLPKISKETENKPKIFGVQDEPVHDINSTQFFPKTGLDLLDNW